MDLSKRLTKLVDEGCLLAVESLYFHVAIAELGKKQLRWVNVFPESQKDAHTLLFDRAEEVFDRDLAFYRDDLLVGYVSPFAEWDNEWSSYAKDERARWLSFLQNPEERERFDSFVLEEWADG